MDKITKLVVFLFLAVPLSSLAGEDKIEGTILNISATEFLQNYSEANYTNFESIRRVRQKLQEENPELRGVRWIERKKRGNNYRKDGL